MYFRNIRHVFSMSIEQNDPISSGYHGRTLQDTDLEDGVGDWNRRDDSSRGERVVGLEVS
jgi:hypothetical protein